MNRSDDKPRNFFLTAPLAFLSLSLLWCQVGYLQPSVSRAIGGLLWLLLVFLLSGKRRVLWFVLSAVLLFNPYGAVHRPEGLWLLPLLPWAGGLWGRRWMGAAFLAALFGWIWSHYPGMWVPIDDLTASISGRLSGTSLSSAAFGLPLFAIAFCFPFSSILSERRFLHPLAAIASLALLTLLYVYMQRGLPASLHHWGLHGLFDAFNLQWILLIFVCVVLFLWGIVDPPGEVEIRKGSAGFVLIFTLAGSLLVGWPGKVEAPQMGKQVVFYNKGYLNWDLPKYGRYGRGASGMFGLVPEYLNWRGFNVVKDDSLTSEDLVTAGVVVFINLMDPLGDSEKEAIYNFVENGGSLLLLGDHTGLADIRDPSNNLLKPYGIELNFDSADPHRTGWSGALVTPEHPLTANIGLVRDGGSSPGKTQIWVGASLKVEPPAKPVIVGRDGFSDIGDEENEEQGYLGDFRYRWDERLGNMVLLAEARPGKGKVLVFGDTSTLQNGAVTRAGPWIEQIFKYLLSPVHESNNTLRTVGMLILVGALVHWAVTGGSLWGLTLGALALFIGAGITSNKTSYQLGSYNPAYWRGEALPRAIIDYSHSPRTPLNMTGLDGTYGLRNCLLRSGFLPLLLESWDETAIQDADLLLEIAPAGKFSKKHLQRIADFMRGGGEVILCCGTEEFDGSRLLLSEVGFEPIYVPLGPAEAETIVTLPVEADTTGAEAEKILTVQFHEVWEVKTYNPNAKVLLEFEDRPVIVYAPIGKGGLLYIADTEFLLNNNLEAPQGDYFEDNILFLRYLLRELAEGR